MRSDGDYASWHLWFPNLPCPRRWRCLAAWVRMYLCRLYIHLFGHRPPNELALILGVAPLLTALLLIAFTLVAALISYSFWEFTEADR